MHCPICATAIELDQTVCPNCKTSLMEYRQVYYAPDILYNEGLNLISQKRYMDACEKLCAANFLRRDDEEILRAWAYAAEKADNIPLALNVLAQLMATSEDQEVEKEFDILSEKLDIKAGTAEDLVMEMLAVQSSAMEKMAEGMRDIIRRHGGADATQSASMLK